MPDYRTFGQKETAELVRAELKRTYKHKFSVTMYRGTSSITVKWTDGPALKNVENILSQFDSSYYEWDSDYHGHKPKMYQGQLTMFYGDPRANRSVSDELETHVYNLMGLEPSIRNGWNDGNELDRRRARDLLATVDADDLLAMTPAEYQAAERERYEREHAEYLVQAAEREAQAKIHQAEHDRRRALTAIVQPLEVIDCDKRTLAMFARLNKRNNLEEYRHECAGKEGEDWDTEQVRVQKVITLSPEHYDIFADNLMEHYDWLSDCQGGAGSDWEPTREVKEWFEYTEAEKELWKAQAYTLGVIVNAEGRAPFIVNTEGYSCARYVGLAASKDSSKEAQPQEETAPAPTLTASPVDDETRQLATEIEFARVRLDGLTALMLETFANFNQAHGAAKLADITAQVAAAERELAELRETLAERLRTRTCTPTSGGWQIVAPLTKAHEQRTLN